MRVKDVAEHSVAAEYFQFRRKRPKKSIRPRDSADASCAWAQPRARALESAAVGTQQVKPGAGLTGLTIVPGHQFQIVDVLLTNFHLPQSSLLLLVSAFAGRELVLSAYHHAVRERYRFYSYGDCMLIT